MRRLSFLIVFCTFLSQAQKSNVHGALFKVDCKACHNSTGWKIDMKKFSYNHDSTGFVLEGVHKKTDCKACHLSLVFTEAKKTCVSCHTDVHGMTVGDDCARCHTAKSWLVDNIPELHEQNGFALVGAHTVLSCADCHKSETKLKWNRIGNECVACHRSDFEKTRNPNHVASNMSTDCITCHDPNSRVWGTNNFHNQFPLKLGHDVADCKACHKTNNYASTSTECVSCHKKNYDGATKPNHVSSNYSTNCIECHSPTPITWNIGNFHLSFPLTLGHDVADCKKCHKSNDYKNISSECVSCHKTNFDNTSAPPHAGSGFSTNCTQCHSASPVNWNISGFHNSFPLTQGHNVPDCKACHKTSNYPATSIECVTCHKTNYDNTTSPPHAANGYSTNCTDCHSSSPVNWNISNFHSSFPLTLGHNVPDCKACHKTGVYKGTPTACVSCHKPNYDNTTAPPHLGSGFSTNCTDCHSSSPINWNVSGYHNSFPLTLGHNVPDCKTCHKTNNYPAISTTCVSCHKTNYDNTTAPPHLSTGFSTNCTDCHSPSPINWNIPGFHSAFPLTLGHNVPDCKACHKTNDYKNTPTTCVSCHKTNYDNTAAPPHSGSGFSTNCTDCHSPTPINWNISGYHNSFPLTLGHNVVDCKTCHKTSNYPATSTACVSCHKTNYDNTTAPPHSGSGYSTNCTDCHSSSPVNWNISGYHNSFPLTLGHNISDCKKCHKTSNYPSTSPDCYSCHVTNYNNATSPNHKTNSFSTNCTDCHNTTPGWASGTYKQHDSQYFPINSGKHQGTWNTCNECHTTSGNFKAFSCIICHEHDNSADLASNHKGVSGYAYVSSACYSCHPTGRK